MFPHCLRMMINKANCTLGCLCVQCQFPVISSLVFSTSNVSPSCMADLRPVRELICTRDRSLCRPAEIGPQTRGHLVLGGRFVALRCSITCPAARQKSASANCRL